jgi:hypothetical protein
MGNRNRKNREIDRKEKTASRRSIEIDKTSQIYKAFYITHKAEDLGVSVCMGCERLLPITEMKEYIVNGVDIYVCGSCPPPPEKL